MAWSRLIVVGLGIQIKSLRQFCSVKLIHVQAEKITVLALNVHEVTMVQGLFKVDQLTSQFMTKGVVTSTTLEK